jgi:ketosteroid isomerase-like protein
MAASHLESLPVTPADDTEERDTARAVSQANVENVSRALASPDPEALFALLAEDVEWDYVGAFPESATYHGPDAVRGFFGQWAGAFDDFGFAAEEVIDGKIVHCRGYPTKAEAFGAAGLDE